MFYEETFLKDLMRQKNRIIYARITSMDLFENPIEYIEGRVTAGSINLDGASAIRRSCSLTLVADEIDISDYYWGLKTKFRLEIGVQNTINKDYSDIVWFDQGIFLITTFSHSFSATAFTINISGKDKGSLLNGELGGTLNSSVDFGKIEEIDKYGNIVIRPQPVKKIIREMLHQYANEPFHNIIINDLDEMGLQLKEYAYDIPLYFLREVNDESGVYANATLNGKQKCWVDNILTTIDDSSLINYDNLVDSFENLGYFPTQISLEGEPGKYYYITKIVYGQTAGYTETDLTFPGDLIANIGESISSVLDKIKNFLGDFEYFYDVNGQFIFQRKKEFITTTWTPLGSSDGENRYIENTARTNSYSYIFSGSEFFTTFNNTPNISNIKNDFTVWGTNQNKLPIHMRYAIDKKPYSYTSISVTDMELQNYNEQYSFVLVGQERQTYLSDDHYEIDEDGIIHCDWREVLYQMSQDYTRYNHLDDFELRVAAANPDLYPQGRTGYEQYYIDLDGFWRQLYNPEFQYQRAYIEEFENNKKYFIKSKEQYYKKMPEINDHFKYYIKTENDIYERVVYPFNLQVEHYIKTSEYIEYNGEFNPQEEYYILDENFYYPEFTKESEQIKIQPRDYWNKGILESPETLLFWFDFLDTEGHLEQFSVPVLGDRAKVVNDNSVTAIHYKDTPMVIFKEFNKNFSEYEGRQTGYKYFNLSSGLERMFYTSSQGKSAKSAIDNLLYNHAYAVESVSITSVPIYYLQPNCRIYINDTETKIEGEYIVSKLTLPLTYNGTMNITATRAAERLL